MTEIILIIKIISQGAQYKKVIYRRLIPWYSHYEACKQNKLGLGTGRYLSRKGGGGEEGMESRRISFVSHKIYQDPHKTL